MFIGVDAKALEWLCIVWLSQDSVGLQELNAGVDQHEDNRVKFGLPTRHIAKIFQFR